MEMPLSDRTKTKAELFQMLAEAVRNTQPQPAAEAEAEPKPETRARKTQPKSKRPAKMKNGRTSARRK
jgi:hypothetical protein